ncbi:MAG TPA: hypothetical protein P5279_03620 [Anaerohalosphaeraceae bacterium]|jgi:tetratricopeptide (TPR) repeat protein|nr:hypothetical protein [Anaerohalosphaeraceae bacterium]HRT49558.1 hypothetical protein [Anaerohalosphaeraceae bacterium]HRT85507.1 hypothetical protein [Anaerohalosphaeraceae bacterium]
MLNLRLKQAQCALSDGQLDEAFRLLHDDAIPRCRAGQKLTLKLAKAFAQRGESHLKAERLQQALSDCNRADELGGNRTEIAALRAAICKAMEDRHNCHIRHNHQLQVARQQMDDGWLSVGAEILTDVEHAEADLLRQETEARRKLADDAAARAAAALNRGQLEEAIAVVRRAGAAAPRMAEQIGQIRAVAAQRITQYLNDGRIDLAEAVLGHVVPLDGQTIELKQLHDAVAICRRAAAAVSTGQAREAAALLNRLALILPQAGWVTAAAEQARKCAEALETLSAGPLGFVKSSYAPQSIEQSAAPVQKTIEPPPPATVKEEHQASCETTIPSRFVLQVDGVGAYLVLRENPTTIGPVSSSRRPAVALMAGSNTPSATIERHDEDYFITADEPIAVGETVLTKKLLASGDKIALSQRCRMKFEVPNAASNTAVLTLSSAKLSRPDISHVILMDRDILIGGGMTHHVRTNDGRDSVVLFVRDGRLYARTTQPVAVDGRPQDARQALPIGVPFKIGTLNMAIISADDGLPHQGH